jgi:hypothetical protein
LPAFFIAVLLIGAAAQATADDARSAPQNTTASALAPDPIALLSQAKEKFASVARRLRRYTCIETIDRTYYAAPIGIVGVKMMTEPPAYGCEGRDFSNGRHLRLEAKDRLRLSVAVDGRTEINSWAAASRFDSRSIFDLVGSGLIYSGAFDVGLLDIFQNPGTQLKFAGRITAGSLERYQYDFDVPLTASHYGVKVGREWKLTAYHGSILINAATAELSQLFDETAQLPAETHLCRAQSTIDYHYVLIGDGEFLLPRRSEVNTTSPDASETNSIITYSGCREYSAESVVRFDGSDVSSDVTEAVPPKSILLAPGLSITLALLNPIDTAIAAAGDPVSAKVVRAVRAAKSRDVLVPAGAVAHGRILEMRRLYDPSQFQISIRFDTLEANGTIAPLALMLEKDFKIESAASKAGFHTRGTEFSLPGAGPPEKGGLFVVPVRTGRYVMRAGVESKWTTLRQ